MSQGFGFGWRKMVRSYGFVAAVVRKVKSWQKTVRSNLKTVTTDGHTRPKPNSSTILEDLGVAFELAQREKTLDAAELLWKEFQRVQEILRAQRSGWERGPKIVPGPMPPPISITTPVDELLEQAAAWCRRPALTLSEELLSWFWEAIYRVQVCAASAEVERWVRTIDRQLERQEICDGHSAQACAAVAQQAIRNLGSMRLDLERRNFGHLAEQIHELERSLRAFRDQCRKAPRLAKQHWRSLRPTLRCATPREMIVSFVLEALQENGGQPHQSTVIEWVGERMRRLGPGLTVYDYRKDQWKERVLQVINELEAQGQLRRIGGTIHLAHVCRNRFDRRSGRKDAGKAKLSSVDVRRHTPKRADRFLPWDRRTDRRKTQAPLDFPPHAPSR